MGELEAILPHDSETVTRIYAWHKRRGDAEPDRPYLGASVLGHECDAYLWYLFRWCVRRTFPGRLYRLFETGDIAEQRFVYELREIGCTVHDRDAQGDQIAVQAHAGHMSGHLDAAILGLPEAPKTWHVGEFKTHNNRSFRDLKAKGVAASKPMHYAQMQLYMGLTKMKRACYLAMNKDTDELWSERVRYVPDDFNALLARAKRIIEATQPPARCAGRSDDYRCKFCEAYDLCWGHRDEIAVPLPRKTCRSCCHATPVIADGRTDAPWHCARLKKDLSRDEQKRACSTHLVLPWLVSFADAVDAGETWIEFENHNTRIRWRHGAGTGAWSTEELMRTPGSIIGNRTANELKEALDGTCVEPTYGREQPPLLTQYPPSDSATLWYGDMDVLAESLEALGLGDLREKTPTRCEDRDGIHYTEFANHAGDGRDILIVTNPQTKQAGVLEGKK